MGITGEDLADLPCGTYTLTVTDANGCTATAEAIVDCIAGVTVSVSNFTNTTCGADNGSISLTAGGGTGTLSYSWSPISSDQAQLNGFACGYVQRNRFGRKRMYGNHFRYH